MTNPAPSGVYRSAGAATLVSGGTDASRVWRYALAEGARAEVALLAADLVRVRLLPAGVSPTSSWGVVRADEEWLAVASKHASGEDGAAPLLGEGMPLDIAHDPLRMRWGWLD